MREPLGFLWILLIGCQEQERETPSAQETAWAWERSASNPILSWDQVPAPNGALYPVIGDPFVLIEGGKHKMWFGYGGLDNTMDEGSVRVRTAYAESDNGEKWTVVAAPALDVGSGWDRSNAETPCVVKDEARAEGDPRRYRLYYSGLDRATETMDFDKLLEVGMGYGIGVAFSADGKRFTRLPAKESPHGVEGLVLKPTVPDMANDPTDLIHVADPHVIVKGDTWHMWYTSFSFDSKRQKTYLAIAYATSKDGIRWEKHGHVVKPDQKWETARDEHHLGRPYVQWTGKRFEMFYDAMTAEGETSAGVGFAVSDDGRTWKKAGDPIFTSNYGKGESKGLMVGTAFYVSGGVYHLIYGGYDPDIHHVVFNHAASKRRP